MSGVIGSYVQANSNSPPSTTSMYNAAAGHRMDTGVGEAEVLDQTRMALKQAYAPPVQFRDENLENNSAQANNAIAGRYNMNAPFPVKYDVPSFAKENLVAREALRRQAPGPNANGGVQLMDHITQDEVEYLKGMEKQSRLADYERYIQKFVDPRQPGQLKWMHEFAPGLLKRQMAQVQQDFDYALRLKLISMYGISDESDLQFLYAVDQGLISGPQLNTPRRAIDNKYVAGMLSPFASYKQRTGLNLPYARAESGFNDEAAGGRGSLRLSDAQQPLATGRNLDQMAAAYWNRDRTVSPNAATDVATAADSLANVNPNSVPARPMYRAGM